MNKQILKLAKESGISFGGHPMNPLNVYPSELEKFAELIIQECADKANTTALAIQMHSKLDARKYVGDSILKSFGVKL
jgi:hypothetical protein